MPEDAPNSARILIVDDDRGNVRLLERWLGDAGYTNLRSGSDARIVMPLYREFQPDLVLLDLHMPHRSGFDVLDDLRLAVPEGSYVPVLVLTGDRRPEALRRALLSGARDFLIKPLDAQEVLLRVRNLLQTRFLHLALQHQNRVLEERVQERSEQLVQAEKLSAMGQLLAGVAHELNNPLAVVLAQALLLQQTGLDVPRRAEKITTAAQRCVRIVRNFLALARERPPARTTTRLNTVVREAVELMAYELDGDGVEIALELDDRLPDLWADPHRLHQALVNLVVNAQHAMRQGPRPRRLTLTTAFDAATARVRLTVTDTGPGIPAAIRARIFDPFFTTKAVGEGTGLGLSLTRGVIEDHAGTISVTSGLGRGATFVVDLPVVAPHPASGVPTPPAAAAPGSSRLLVVDDELEVAAVLAEVLRLDGHTVDTAANGYEALEKLDAQAYDLILTDTKMPRLDGQGLYRALEQRRPELLGRVAFITGDVLSPDKLAFLMETAAPTVEKPFDLDEVRQAVRTLLQRVRGAEG